MFLRIIHLSYIGLLSLFLVGCSLGTKISSSSNSSQTGNLLELQTGATLTTEQKAELALNRRKQIRLVRKGDYYVAKNNPDEALPYYLQVYEKLPNDIVIEKKIADAYFLRKDFSNAYLFYSKIPLGELNSDERKKYFQSLFFQSDQTRAATNLQNVALTESERTYFSILGSCTQDLEACSKTILAYTGSSLDIISLQDTLLKAPKITPDTAYRNFSLATALYILGAYDVSYEITKKILTERGDYFNVEKLSGYNLAALGRYTEAGTALKQYLENVPNDTEVIIKLGEIATIEREYLEANLYFNNAISAGFTPKTNLERQLAYNYSAFGDTAGMIKVLSYLLTEKDVVEEDYAVAISLAFDRGENTRAYVWAIEGLKKYPNSAMLSPLYMKSLRVLGRGADIVGFVSTLSGEVLDSPLVTLERGIYEFDNASYDQAKIFFEKVKSIDPDADFSIEAENYLEQIDQKRSESGSTDTSGADNTHKWW